MYLGNRRNVCGGRIWSTLGRASVAKARVAEEADSDEQMLMVDGEGWRGPGEGGKEQNGYFEKRKGPMLRMFGRIITPCYVLILTVELTSFQQLGCWSGVSRQLRVTRVSDWPGRWVIGRSHDSELGEEAYPPRGNR